MTEKDKEMQELRRENARLLKENKRLEAQHQVDMAELVSVRRRYEVQIRRMEENEA